MDEIDSLLSLVENPTRRRILEALVREPHYPLQLSKELGVSQQAVMKNLSLLEQSGLVVSYRETSTMGPMRTLYVPNTEFTLMIDMHNCMFTTKLIKAPATIESRDRRTVEESLEEAVQHVRDIDRRIGELNKVLSDLLRERNEVLTSFMNSLPDELDYTQRRMVYEALDNPSDNEDSEGRVKAVTKEV